jgi:hypothetical protein
MVGPRSRNWAGLGPIPEICGQVAQLLRQVALLQMPRGRYRSASGLGGISRGGRPLRGNLAWFRNRWMRVTLVCV